MLKLDCIFLKSGNIILFFVPFHLHVLFIVHDILHTAHR